MFSDDLIKVTITNNGDGTQKVVETRKYEENGVTKTVDFVTHRTLATYHYDELKENDGSVRPTDVLPKGSINDGIR